MFPEPHPHAHHAIMLVVARTRVFLLLSWSFLSSGSTLSWPVREPKDIVQREVFKAGEEGYFCFRIPALIFTVKGTLLAFAEGRGSVTKTCSDHGPDVHIVLKRSCDLGKTWSKLSVVYAEPNHTIGNPAPVVEEATGLLILAFCRDNKEVFTIESGDDGITWSNMVNITEEVTEPGWGFVATGPPGGIQLPSGRLIIGTYSDPGSYAIYSDDGGKSWHRSQPTGNTSTGECQVAAFAETDTPSLILAMRSSSGRFLAYSSDGGETWDNLTLATSLNPQSACESSIIAIPYKGAFRDTHLYLSAPHSFFRINMTIFTSSDGGNMWKAGPVLWGGPSAYSSLAYNKLKLYCLYERGENSFAETLTLAVVSPLILH